MEFSALEIAQLLDGEIQGNPDKKVYRLSKIEEGTEGSLSFLANPKYINHLYKSQSSVVLVSNDFEPEKGLSSTLIRVADPYAAFSKLLKYCNRVSLNRTGIEKPSFTGEKSSYGKNIYLGAFSYLGNNVIIGNNVKIYPNTFIGDNVSIGDDTVLFSGVKVHSDSQIGMGCKFHSNVVIGSDGFGFAPNHENKYEKVPQIGNVVVGNHVEIGANTTIDRATLGSTTISNGVKLDNLIQIAHNVSIGENTVIASQVGIAGSTKIGKNCMIGGQVGIVGHITIGDNVKIAAQSGIGSDLKNGAIVQGSPAFSVSEYKRSYIYFKKLPQLIKTIDELEKQLSSITSNKHV